MNKHMFFTISCIAGLVWLLSACATVPASPAPTQAPPPSDTAIPPTATLVPTDTPVPTATLTNTPAPSATATPDESATLQAAATQAAEELIGEISPELEAVGLSTESGSLLWVQDEPLAIDLVDYQEWRYVPFAEDLVASDFVLKSDITWESTSGLLTCGLFFRSEKNMEEGKQYYYEMLRLSGLPAWDIVYLQYNQFQKNITDVRTNSAIHQDQGSTNKVVLIAEQEKFTVYINDVRAGSFYDYGKNVLEGYFAFSAAQESGESTCTFANTWVWSLE
jgi:hypothetical protein